MTIHANINTTVLDRLEHDRILIYNDDTDNYFTIYKTEHEGMVARTFDNPLLGRYKTIYCYPPDNELIRVLDRMADWEKNKSVNATGVNGDV